MAQIVDTPVGEPVVDAQTASCGSPAVEIKNMVKRFGRNVVVNNLTLSIEPGTVYGLIGPNGAGKSTTLKAMMRMHNFNAGEITLLGHDVRNDFQAVKNRIGFVPEAHYIYSWMKVKQVIRFTASFYPTWNPEVADQLMRLFRLEPNRKVRKLSKGMLAKLALLLAISHEPELLVLDEPLNGLDPIVREEFLDGVLKAICDREMTVVFSSHSMDDVQRIADSVGILFEGQLLANTTVDNLLSKTKRLQIVRDSDEPIGWLPESTISVRQQGRETTIAVSDFSTRLLEEVQSKYSSANVAVEAVSLEDAFKDYIRGSREKETMVKEIHNARIG